MDNKKTITKEEFEKIKKQYDCAVQARAYTIRVLRGTGMSFSAIASHFGISRQAAQKIYKETAEQPPAGQREKAK